MRTGRHDTTACPCTDRQLQARHTGRVAAAASGDPDYPARWSRWQETLLAAGGCAVIPPHGRVPLLTTLVDTAAVHDGGRTVIQPGAASDCHRNTARLWQDGTAAGIGTGFALSDDGLWRQHTWAVTPDGTIIETTTRRGRYAGIVLTGDTADAFAALVTGTLPTAV